jgi:two-component system cell cycle sensor histidine kinase/response regulator CckA
MSNGVRLSAFAWRLLGLFCFASLIFVMGGAWYYRLETRKIGAQKYEDLKAIAELKAAEVVSWRKERAADALLNSTGIIGDYITRWLEAPDDPSLKSAVIAHLREMKESEGYENIIVAGVDGKLKLSLKPGFVELDPVMKRELAGTLESGHVVFGDLFKCPVCRKVHMDVTAPIVGAEGAPIGVLFLRVDAEDYLFPLIESWPTPSRTSETVLVRGDSSEVVFLNKPRHVPDSALSFRVPLSKSDVPAVRAVLGQTGKYEGKDYRGVRVLADIRGVPDSPWYMVAKVDSAEIFAEAQYHGRAIMLVVALFILMTGILAVLYFNRQEKRAYRELYRVERERREAQGEIRTTLYSIGDGVIVVDVTGTVKRMNPVAERLTGWREAEASGSRLEQVFHIVNEDTGAEIESPVQRILREGMSVGLSDHTLLIARDGSERPIADSGSPIRDEQGTVTGVVLVFRDQTEERRAERALRARATELGAIIESIADGILVVAGDGRVMRANSRFGEMWRIPKELLASKDDGTLLGFVLDQLAEPEEFLSKVRELYGSDRLSHDTIHFKDGRIFDRVSCPLLEEGTIVGRVWIFRDVTESRRSEDELQKMYLAVEQSPVSVVITDFKGNIEYVNPKFTEVTGFSLKEARGRNPRILKSGETSPEEYRALWETITSGREWRGVFRNRRKDGTFFWERASISPVRDAAGAIVRFIGVKEDITAQRKMEDQLRQAQKMESVGRLAGGVAHDFNNMLEVIIGHAELALSSAEMSSALRGNLQEILKAAERSAAFTRQLLAFARKQPVSPYVIDLNGVMAGMISMLRRLVGEHIDLKFEPGEELWPVKMDPSQVDQIMANLALNARDAIAGIGETVIATSNVVLDEAEVAYLPGCSPGEYVLLTVSDNGEGMDGETLEHIFEPFFTTKEVGRGTGLGLATVYGIVKQNGGYIGVTSAPGKGTAFKIYLPRIRENAKAHAEKTKRGGLRGTETVLLVEDEEAILNLAKAILTQFGYRVLTARTPGIALALAEKYSAPIDLLITDIVMPDMNGKQLRNQMESLRPGLKCLYISGYTVDVIARYNILDDGIHFLQKPFSVEAFAEKVRDVLDEE